MQIKAKLMFLILGISLLITAFLFRGATYEIQLYDTYVIISWATIFGYLGLFSVVVEGVYVWLARTGKQSGKAYKLVHVGITVISIGLLYVSQTDFFAMSGTGRRYSAVFDFEIAKRAANLGAGAILLFTIVQLLFMIDVLVALLNRRRTS